MGAAAVPPLRWFKNKREKDFMRTSNLHMLGSLSIASLLAACAPGAGQGDSTGEREVRFVEHGGNMLPSLYDTEGSDPEQPGLCAALESYDVVARGAVGDYTEVAVVVENRCLDRELSVHSVELLDVDGSFELAGPLPDHVAPGGAAEIRLGFVAQGEFIHLGELLVVTDAPAAPRQLASLFGVVPVDGQRSGAAPTADAGPDYNVCQVGVSEPLDASGSSDPEGDTLTYRWSFKTLPDGSALSSYGSITDDENVTASFIPDVEGAYMVRLVVNDGTSIGKDFSQWTATISGTNAAPIADAGAFQSILLGNVATMDGSASSDPDGDTLTYEWMLKSVPVGSAITSGSLSGAATDTMTFTPDVAGAYGFKLRVFDGVQYDSDWAYVVAAENNPPVADGGPNQTVGVSTPVTLDGTGSSDADGDTLSYTWSFKTKPGGSALVNDDITNRFTDTASFTPDVTGAWRIRLTVDDGTVSDVDFVDVTVE